MTTVTGARTLVGASSGAAVRSATMSAWTRASSSSTAGHGRASGSFDCSDAQGLASVSAALGGALGLEALEGDLRVIREPHRGREGAVAGALGDQPVQRLCDPPVGGMALRGAAELDQVHRLARVHLHIKA